MLLIVAALATWQIIEIWHHSLLFSRPRSIVEMWDSKLGELLVCPWCVSPWVALLCIVCLQSAENGLVGLTASTIIYSFAISRLANLGNDFFKQHTRTPQVNFDYGTESTDPNDPE